MEKISSAKNIPHPENTEESLNSDNPHLTFLLAMSWQVAEILDGKNPRDIWKLINTMKNGGEIDAI